MIDETHRVYGGRTARVEFSRYRCYLLGLPEDMLMDTPQVIVYIMNARNGTLRKGFDDETCGALIRATLAAYLPPDKSLGNRMFDAVERRIARVIFVQHFLGGDQQASRDMGIDIKWSDYALAALLMPTIAAKTAIYRQALKSPVLGKWADDRLTQRIPAPAPLWSCRIQKRCIRLQTDHATACRWSGAAGVRI